MPRTEQQRIYLRPPSSCDAPGWRWAVFLKCGRCGDEPCNFIGLASGWIEAQKMVDEYLAAVCPDPYHMPRAQ